MKISVFTSNQPRHIGLIRQLVDLGHQVRAVLETTPVQQVGSTASASRRFYMAQVFEAERRYFGASTLTPPGVSVLALPMGQVNSLSEIHLADVLDSDRIIVFGADFIKGWLVDALIDRRAINIHMGLSPYFRGAACNFWALYEGLPLHVGGTIHYLSRGLDSGGMIRHAVPRFTGETPFEFSMKAVLSAQQCLIDILHRPLPPMVEQDRSLEIRYTKSADFTDETIDEYLTRDLTPATLGAQLETAATPELLAPFYL